MHKGTTKYVAVSLDGGGVGRQPRTAMSQTTTRPNRLQDSCQYAPVDINIYNLYFLPQRIYEIPFLPNISQSVSHTLPGATTHAGSWPTQEATSSHLYLWPWPSSS